MALEDLMGFLLFVFGFLLMVIGIVDVLGLFDILQGAGQIIGFIIFGFLLCVTGFIMARSSFSDMWTRIQR